MSILKKTAHYFARKKFCRNAIDEQADLSAFKDKLTLSIVIGIILIALSYVTGMPSVIALGIIAVWLDKPLIGIIGGPLIYSFSTVIFIIGVRLAGKKYFMALCRWLMRVSLEKILGDEVKD